MTMMERIEKMRVSDDALDLVFRKARTYSGWLPKPVPEELLRQLYDTLKGGPTSANISPARFLFIRSAAALFVSVWTTALLLPNPIMPASVVHSHFWETLGFSLLFDSLAGWLMSNPHKQEHRAA